MENKNCNILIKNATILNGDFEIERDKTLVINNGVIEKILNSDEGYTSENIIDRKGFLWMPGLTDGHMHTAQQMLRGRILDELPMIWTRIMVPFESSLTREDINLSAHLSSIEMIKKGTTSFIDAGGPFIDEAAKVYIDSGLRGGVTYSTMDDKGVPPTMRNDVDECILNLNRLYDEFNGAGNGRIKVYYSLRSLISCSQELIEGVFNEANLRGAAIQAHMNEYPNEVNFFLEKYKLRPLEYLNSLGVLSDRFLSAHSIMLSQNEMDIIKDNKVKVVHCPFSNCGKGIPDTPALLQKGVSVGLGSDGTAHGGMDIFQEMKVFRSIMNLYYGTKSSSPNIMSAKDILSIATKGGASALMEEGSLGEIREGYKADLVALDLNESHLYPTNNIVNTIVESVSGSDVKHMIVNGKLIMKDREILTIDEEKVRYNAARGLESKGIFSGDKCYY
ncbi:MAG: amidohydrolase family protein [Clostridium sp.]